MKRKKVAILGNNWYALTAYTVFVSGNYDITVYQPEEQFTKRSVETVQLGYYYPGDTELHTICKQGFLYFLDVYSHLLVEDVSCHSYFLHNNSKKTRKTKKTVCNTRYLDLFTSAVYPKPNYFLADSLAGIALPLLVLDKTKVDNYFSSILPSTKLKVYNQEEINKADILINCLPDSYLVRFITDKQLPNVSLTENWEVSEGFIHHENYCWFDTLPAASEIAAAFQLTKTAIANSKLDIGELDGYEIKPTSKLPYKLTVNKNKTNIRVVGNELATVGHWEGYLKEQFLY